MTIQSKATICVFDLVIRETDRVIPELLSQEIDKGRVLFCLPDGLT